MLRDVTDEPRVHDELVLHGGRIRYKVVDPPDAICLHAERSQTDREGRTSCAYALRIPLEVWRDLSRAAASASRA